MESLVDDGSRTIQRQVDVDTYTTGFFDVDRTVETIVKYGYRRIALQMPDEMLSDSSSVVHQIQERVPDAIVFVLGDTSYGSCCVDEVNANHHNADFIVHYGQSCLSRTTALPMLLVFGRKEWNDLSKCAALVNANKEESLVILRDVGYEYKIDSFVKLLAELGFRNVYVPPLDESYYDPKEEDVALPSSSIILGHRMELTDFDNCVYIGSPKNQIAQINLKLCRTRIMILDPSTCTIQNAERSIISKRFLKMQQAKDASVFGILVGTMGVQGYEKVIAHLKSIIANAGRKSYTFLMGKLNPQKLANFPIVDAYVLVACEQNSLIDSKEFFQPIVTPWEIEIAFGQREWSEHYSCSFADLSIDKPLPQHDHDLPHFSTTSGTYLNPTTSKRADAGDRHITIQYASVAGDALSTMSFRGLEPNKGDKEPAKAISGQVGIASALYSLDDSKKQTPR